MSMAEHPTPMARALRLMQDYPLLPLGLLLAGLVLLLEILQPGIVNPRWLGNSIKLAIPLAMLAACQTLTMLTGGIDLSVGIIATVAAFVTGTLSPIVGVPEAVAVSLTLALLLGLLNGFGVAVCRVHPLIMTLGTGLIATGLMQVYQRYVIATGVQIPDFLLWLGIKWTYGLPNSLVLFLPFAVLILWAQRRTGFGRLLYAMGSNEKAARLSGVRGWQVLMALYVLSGAIAGIAGLLYLGMIKQASLSLMIPMQLPSVAAAVIGGTSIFGGRGGFGGTILGALILTVLASMLTMLHMPEGGRRILFGLIVLAVTALFVRLTDNT
jgi:ribose transport system permease protein